MKLNIFRLRSLKIAIAAIICIPSLHGDNDFNDFMNVVTNDPEVVNAVNHGHFNPSRAVADSSIVEVLISLGANKLLQLDLFLETHVLNSRDIIDNPLFLSLRDCYENKWVVGGHLFWNQMDRAYFTEHSDAISSYLAIQSPELLELLNSPDVSQIISGFDIDPLNVLPLFANMTIQERKFGLMFHADRQSDRCNFRIWAPFYYLERNFFLTEAEQEAIEEVLGKGSQDDAEAFAQDHMISDQLGLGDTRITLDFRILDKPCVSMEAGVLLTMPTAFAFVKGLMGKDFKRSCVRPTLDFNQLFDLGRSSKQGQDQASAMAEDFFLTVLDNLAANLLQTSLGNNGHVGIGTYLQTQSPLGEWIKRPWATNFLVENVVSLEYLFPATEQRSFIAKNTLAQFNALNLNRSSQAIIDQANSDPAYASNVLNFLELQTVNQLIPFAFKAKVCPGFIARSTSKIGYENAKAGFYLGSDFWIQTEETLKDIQWSCSSGNPPNIDVSKATRTFAYQYGTIGSVFYKVIRPNKIWTLSLNGFITMLSSGIGQDFTVSLNIEANF